MTITPLPTPPARTDGEATFVSRSNAFLGALPTFGTEANALAAAVSADKAATETAAAIAPVSLAAANFKGNWSALTGALAVPASVFHSGAFWTLASDLADVTAKTPGVDVEWLDLSTSSVDYQEFTASGTWTKPSGVSVVYVEAIGGGGGGGNHTSTTAYGGGGGGGFNAGVFQASDLGATVTVTIGAGGTGGANGINATGVTGGDTTFGAALTGKGGGGGLSTSATQGGGEGGGGERGGTTSNGEFGFGGYASGGGGLASRSGGNSVRGGAGGGGSSSTTGGTSLSGGNGGRGNNSGGGAGFAGTAPGGGGGGSQGDGGGGAGAAGRVRVWAW
jgi:hypothetical protein